MLHDLVAFFSFKLLLPLLMSCLGECEIGKKKKKLCPCFVQMPGVNPHQPPWLLETSCVIKYCRQASRKRWIKRTGIDIISIQIKLWSLKYWPPLPCSVGISSPAYHSASFPRVPCEASLSHCPSHLTLDLSLIYVLERILFKYLAYRILIPWTGILLFYKNSIQMSILVSTKLLSHKPFHPFFYLCDNSRVPSASFKPPPSCKLAEPLSLELEFKDELYWFSPYTLTPFKTFSFLSHLAWNQG